MEFWRHHPMNHSSHDSQGVVGSTERIATRRQTVHQSVRPAISVTRQQRSSSNQSVHRSKTLTSEPGIAKSIRPTELLSGTWRRTEAGIGVKTKSTNRQPYHYSSRATAPTIVVTKKASYQNSMAQHTQGRHNHTRARTPRTVSHLSKPSQASSRLKGIAAFPTTPVLGLTSAPPLSKNAPVTGLPDSHSTSAFSPTALAVVGSISALLVLLLLALCLIFWRRRQRLEPVYRVQVTARTVSEPALELDIDHLLPDERIVDYYDYGNNTGSMNAAPIHTEVQLNKNVSQSTTVFPLQRANNKPRHEHKSFGRGPATPAVKSALMVELTAALQTRRPCSV